MDRNFLRTLFIFLYLDNNKAILGFISALSYFQVFLMNMLIFFPNSYKGAVPSPLIGGERLQNIQFLYFRSHGVEISNQGSFL